MNPDVDSSYDCEQQKIAFWNNSNRFSHEVYIPTQQGKYDKITAQANGIAVVQDGSLFRRCLRGDHAVCRGFVTTDGYKSFCKCPCHNIVEGLRSSRSSFR